MYRPPQDTVSVKGIDSLSIPLDTHLLPALVHREMTLPQLEFFRIDSAVAHREAMIRDTMTVVSPFLRPSLFSATEYKGNHPNPLISPINPAARNFTGAVLLLVFSLIVVLRLIAPRKSMDYLRAVFNRKSFFKFIDEEEPSWLPPMPVFLASASMLTGAAIAASWLDPSGFSSVFMYFLTSAGIIIAAYILPVLRAGGLWALANILQVKEHARLLIQFSYLNQVLFALLLMPAFLAIALGVDIHPGWAGVSVIFAFGIVLAVQFFRLLRQFRSEGWFSVLNFFLYFCTLEIAPLLLFYKCYRLMEQ